MNVSAFLVQLALRLEGNAISLRDRRALALYCRDYAMLAMFAESELPDYLGERIPVAATTSVDDA
jgi:hypothetical protein